MGDRLATIDMGRKVGVLCPFIVCSGQTAGWIKMSLGMEVGLGPGHIVLDGDLAPPKKGHNTPTFRRS